MDVVRQSSLLAFVVSGHFGRTVFNVFRRELRAHSVDLGTLVWFDIRNFVDEYFRQPVLVDAVPLLQLFGLQFNLHGVSLRYFRFHGAAHDPNLGRVSPN